MQSADHYLKKINIGKEIRQWLYRAMLVLSLVVALGVFWELKLTGITMAGEAFCGIEEHVHSEACIPKQLICQKEEAEPHTHTLECRKKVLQCTLQEQEGHIHSEACGSGGIRYLCGQEAVLGHFHADSCYSIPERVLICGVEEQEGHIHTPECGNRETGYLCGQKETQAHFHSDNCYGLSERTLLCAQEEVAGHSHSADCGIETIPYACGRNAAEAHSHSDTCYTYASEILICQLEETEGHFHSSECGSDENGYLCGLEEIEPHFHEETCYFLPEEFIVCGLEETEGYLHSETCYKITGECSKEEHVHIASCYSDLTADLESVSDWKNILADLGENPDLVQVAQSQLGYQESVRNFQVDENDRRSGITRYGQWYGNPYGDWSAMFVGFCLHYGGGADLPVNAGPEAMRLEWEAAGLYAPAADFAPAPGNLMFLDKDGNTSADAIAIIVSITDGQIQAIEGDMEDAVAETCYAAEDPVILGYGRIPVKQLLQPGEGTKLIAQTEDYNPDLFTAGSSLVVYVTDGTEYYAIDGNGELIQVIIDEEGLVYTDLEVPEMLLWNVTVMADGSYVIENVITKMYLPEAPMSVSMYALTEEEPEPGPNYQYARAANYTVWLDGTHGGLMSYGDAENIPYTVTGGTTFVLPETLKSNIEYSYKVKGWYDVINNRYYAPGTSITVNSNLVFYPDWIASSYDIGRFNSLVANTVSTNEFVTTRLFDYNTLFNVLSSSASVSVDNKGHTETWRLLTSGNSPYSGQPTLNYIFRDWDQGNQDITYPNGVNNPSPHYPTNAGEVYPNLYNDRIGSLLFDPEQEVIGKEYLGTADHMFQLCTDPSDPNYGYYYYDSELNAASYNQSDQRFYVYEYLEQTTVSSSNGESAKYSDFLPLNSPYVNTNNRAPATYSYRGKNGEYNGVTHYMYDATNSGTSNVATNFFFGMSVEIDFYLPNAPGSNANQDVYGKDMHFRFSGDDDVWVFVDGKLVLDLGGIHGIESGDINFSSGVVTINSVRNDNLTNTLKSIGAGEHKLTLYYLERGSSMSNCAIYFNLAPRFSFSIQKEDVLTQNVLNGAQFSVYTDRACTTAAQLWVSKESHDRGDPATNVFTVTNGVADMWGMGAGNTYYIKETKPPDAADYTYACGIICVTIDKQGQASYSVELLEENGQISGGFTVHGFRIDEQTQKAYIVATNAPSWVTQTTGVWAFKKWADGKNHTGEAVTVYLTVTDADGTVRRLQEAQLSSENGWKHRWENLPRYAKDGVTPIEYGVEEAYVSGYFSKVNETESFTVVTNQWQTTTTLENGKTYLLSNGDSYLSTLNSNSDTGFQWVSRDTAQSSNLALWTVKASGNKVMLTNGAGQTLSFYYGNGGYITDFFAATSQTEDNNVKRNFNYSVSGNAIRLYYDANTDYYLSPSLNDSKKFSYTTSSGSALSLTPWTYVQTTTSETVEGWGFEIVNTPLTEETSLTVTKQWNYGHANISNLHEQSQVTVALMANGKDTGRRVTLSLKNNWTGTFLGLPYKDDSGTVIVYTVEETWDNPDWRPVYGPVTVVNGNPPTYSTYVINQYIPGTGGPELPSTGSRSSLMYILCGSSVLLFPLVYGIGTRCKRERRMK